MKIVVIGATGTIGRAVVSALAPRHEIVSVGKSSGQYQVDITNPKSLEELFGKIGKVGAIVSTTGDLHFGPLTEMTPNDFRVGVESKLLGQVNVALIGQRYLDDDGSITLTSGIVSDEPIPGGTNGSAVNAAIDGFVRGAAVGLRRGQRINSVSPTILEESVAAYGSVFAGFEAAPASRVAQAYVRSVEGAQTGRTYRVW